MNRLGFRLRPPSRLVLLGLALIGLALALIIRPPTDPGTESATSSSSVRFAMSSGPVRVERGKSSIRRAESREELSTYLPTAEIVSIDRARGLVTLEVGDLWLRESEVGWLARKSATGAFVKVQSQDGDRVRAEIGGIHPDSLREGERVVFEDRRIARWVARPFQDPRMITWTDPDNPISPE